MDRSTPAPDAQAFPARYAAVRDVAAFAEAFAQRHGVARGASLRLRLVLEELFTNTIRHGHAGESDATVWIALAREPGAVRLRYEDSAPPFDPFAGGAPPPAEGADRREVGGLGLPLVREIAAFARYAFADGRNRVELAIEDRA